MISTRCHFLATTFGFLKLQDRPGGWITDYDTTGQPLGLANVETTCLVLLALETYGR
jgi:hypothetical protein